MISKLLTNFCCLAEKSNTKFFSIKSLFLALLCIGSLSIQAQVSSYSTTSTSVAQTYTAITTGGGATGVFGTNVNATLDNAVSGAIPIGFNFNFNGKVYTTCFVSFNGFITFGTAPTTTNFKPISSTETYEGVIAAYGMDLKGTGVDVLKYTTGAVGNRTFTLQWTVYRSALANGPMNAQIILHESDVLNVTNPGLVEINYKTAGSALFAAQTFVANGEVGLRGEKNHDFNNKTYNVSGAWPTANPVFGRGTANNAFVSTRYNVTSPNAAVTFTPPSCLAPRKIVVVPTSITTTAVNFSWLAAAPVPASGYEYMVTTLGATDVNQTNPVAATTSPFMGTTAGLTGSVTGLAAGTVYYIYVRSNCGPNSGWSAYATFRTLCAAVMPYTQNFNTVTLPGIDVCDGLQTFSSGATATLGTWVSSDASAPNAWGFFSRHLRIQVNTGNDNEAWFYTSGVAMTAGTSYRISYRYGASGTFSYTEQQLSLSYGTLPYSGSMTTQIANHSNLKGGAYTNVINFVAPSTGTYYFGFLDESVDGNETTLIDDIDIRPTTCFAPTLLAATGITSGSATINWNALATPPSGGYQYYVSTTNTPP
ncbi:MAG TPA: fibronectin type III domain-containing protein, partial [Flavobacterium sp.]|nr:fibronectin type III domain-containing protein [Flavobacterium sp.]